MHNIKLHKKQTSNLRRLYKALKNKKMNNAYYRVRTLITQINSKTFQGLSKTISV